MNLTVILSALLVMCLLANSPATAADVAPGATTGPTLIEFLSAFGDVNDETEAGFGRLMIAAPQTPGAIIESFTRFISDFSSGLNWRFVALLPFIRC